MSAEDLTGTVEAPRSLDLVPGAVVEFSSPVRVLRLVEDPQGLINAAQRSWVTGEQKFLTPGVQFIIVEYDIQSAIVTCVSYGIRSIVIMPVVNEMGVAYLIPEKSLKRLVPVD